MARHISKSSRSSSVGRKSLRPSAHQVLDVVGAGRESLRSRDEDLLIRVHVDDRATPALVQPAKQILVPQGRGGSVEVVSLESAYEDKPDLVLIISNEPAPYEVVHTYVAHGVPVGVLSQHPGGLACCALPQNLQPLAHEVVATNPADVPKTLVAWMAKACQKPIALAANFAHCRQAVVDGLISGAAVANAVVGGISLIPGSDFPIMCASQLDLAMKIAAAYGEGMSPTRAAELAGVVGSGLALRSAARTLAGMIPGIGLIIKAGIAYGGTMAMGKALQLHLNVSHRSDDTHGDGNNAQALSVQVG